MFQPGLAPLHTRLTTKRATSIASSKLARLLQAAQPAQGGPGHGADQGQPVAVCCLCVGDHLRSAVLEVVIDIVVIQYP